MLLCRGHTGGLEQCQAQLSLFHVAPTGRIRDGNEGEHGIAEVGRDRAGFLGGSEFSVPRGG